MVGLALILAAALAGDDTAKTAALENVGKQVSEWSECTIGAAKGFARKTAEPADLIADAALALCGPFVDEIERLAGTAEVPIDAVRKAMDRRIVDQRRTLILTVITARMPPKR